jgi:hypothetical protein
MTLVDRRGAAAFCRVSVASFERHVRPKLPELSLGRKVWFREEDLQQWAAAPSEPAALPAPKPRPNLDQAELRQVRRMLTRGQRVKLGLATPDEIEAERALAERRAHRQR